MKITTFALGPVQANCYIVSKDGECLIIDPGDSFDFKTLFEKEGLSPIAVLLTHAHFDHIAGVDDLLKEYELPVYLHPSEHTFLADPATNSSMYFYYRVICQAHPVDLKPGVMHIGPFRITVMHTPGHSCGSCCFKIEDCLFSGDTLFQGSIGRMDLPTGSVVDMKESIRTLKKLPESCKVYPGHGPETTIGIEKKMNWEWRNIE